MRPAVAAGTRRRPSARRSAQGLLRPREIMRPAQPILLDTARSGESAVPCAPLGAAPSSAERRSPRAANGSHRVLLVAEKGELPARRRARLPVRPRADHPRQPGGAEERHPRRRDHSRPCQARKPQPSERISTRMPLGTLEGNDRIAAGRGLQGGGQPTAAHIEASRRAEGRHGPCANHELAGAPRGERPSYGLVAGGRAFSNGRVRNCVADRSAISAPV